jgi:hypothetical protein
MFKILVISLTVRVTMPVSLKGEGYIICFIGLNPLTLNETGFLTVYP